MSRLLGSVDCFYYSPQALRLYQPAIESWAVNNPTGENSYSVTWGCQTEGPTYLVGLNQILPRLSLCLVDNALSFALFHKCSLRHCTFASAEARPRRDLMWFAFKIWSLTSHQCHGDFPCLPPYSGQMPGKRVNWESAVRADTWMSQILALDGEWMVNIDVPSSPDPSILSSIPFCNPFPVVREAMFLRLNESSVYKLHQCDTIRPKPLPFEGSYHGTLEHYGTVPKLWRQL